MSPKISKDLSIHRFVVKPETTMNQIETAKELLNLAEKYINENL